MTPSPPRPATSAGPYQIVDRIAVGGMAEVFRALEPRSVGDPRTVVVKRMLPHVAAEADAHAMFAEEARLGAKVDHPNVVRLLDSGEEAGQPYLVLEYVPGCDLWRLGRFLTREGKVLSTELSLFVASEMLAGLEAIHEATDEEGRPLGIVHLDVSPSNVLLSIYGDVKVSDFGIARARRRSTTSSSLTGRAKGKIGYLAPELVVGRVADRRADVFSAAVITAELLIGRPLFAGGSELAVLLSIRDARIEPLLEAAPSLPAGVVEALLGALRADPAERTEDARTLRDALLPHVPEPAILRRELAELVASVSASDPVSIEPPPTRPAELVPELPVTPVALPDVPPAKGGASPAYTVTTSHGGTLGTYSFAGIVEAIATGRVGMHDLVKVGEAEPRPIYGILELARHLPASSLTPVTQEAPHAAPVAHRAEMKDAGFVVALAETIVERSTGLWLCEQGAVRKEVYVKDGVPVFVTSNQAGELLGEFLVARGVISRGELDMALAVMPRFEGKLGDTLVGLGLVEPVHLFQHIGAQVTEKLLDVFLWTTGTACFYRDAPSPPSAFPLGLDGFAILDEGIRRRMAQGLDREMFATHLADSLVHAQRIPTAVATGRLPGLVRRALVLTRTPTPVQEVVATLEDPSGRDPGRGYRAVALLLHLGALRWTG